MRLRVLVTVLTTLMLSSSCGLLVALGGGPDGGDLDGDSGSLPGADAGPVLDAGEPPADGGAQHDDAGDVPDAGTADAGPPPPCGTVSMLEDELADSDSSRFIADVSEGATLQFSDEKLRVVLPAATVSHGGGRARWRTSLLGDGLTLELVELVPTAGVQTRFLVREDDERGPSQAAVQLAYVGGVVSAFITDASGSIAVPGHSFQTSTHRFWRIRAPSSERLLVEVATSAEGPFAPLLDTTPPAFVADGWVGFGATSDGNNESAAVVFERIGGQLALPSWCPAHELVDGFTSNALSRQWSANLDTKCTVSVSAGALQIAQGQAGALDCGITSTTPRELAGSAMTVIIGDAPSSGGVFTGMVLFDSGNGQLSLGLRDGAITAAIEGTLDGETVSANKELPAPTLLPVRLRVSFDDDAQVAFFERQDDSLVWEGFWSYGPLPALNDVRASLRLVGDDPGTQGALAIIHSVNVDE